MNEIDIYNGLGMIVNDDDTNSRADYGTPRHSGRYPWGSGEKPQRNRDIKQRVKDLEEKGLTREQIATALGYENTNELKAAEKIAENEELKARIKDLKGKGLTQGQIAAELGYKSTTDLRAAERIATNEIKKSEYDEMRKLFAEGYGYSEIGRIMGKNESSIRSAMKTQLAVEGDLTTKTAEVLKDSLKSHKYIDIGEGVELYLDKNISKERMKTAIAMLEQEGYETINVRVDQLGTKNGQKTTIKVLAPPGTKPADVRYNLNDISSTWMLERYSEDGGFTFRKKEPPVSIDSKRVFIRYGEDHGGDKEGVIEIRPGVEDLNLGLARYSQVRIALDNKYYLKGMGVYSNDIPDGYDICLNTTKSSSVPREKIFKEMKTNPDGSIYVENPFGAMIKDPDRLELVKQQHYIGTDGKEHLNAINVVNEQGDWSKWKRKISSQFLSKQLPATAKQQLDLSYSIKKSEYDEIKSLTNPIVKQSMLQEFADECDSSSVHLKAAGFARQHTHVILPINSLKENEVYAPNYKTGEPVVLVRFPHAGRFEIPLLRVNNNNKEGKDILGSAPDAIGINHKVAGQLSGADFDGDTVVVIPVSNVNIKTEKPIKDLREFDTKVAYAIPEEKKFTKEEEKAWNENKKEALKRYPGLKDKIPRMTSKMHGRQMGEVSNLITDMTLQSAKQEDIVKAVRHSMVVVDAEKHYLDWKQSEKDNDIQALRQKYQMKPNGKYGGASTLISMAKSPKTIPERVEITNINTKRYSLTEQEKKDFAEGKKIFRDTNKTHNVPDKKAGLNEQGKPAGWLKKPNTMDIPKMEFYDDARALSSGTIMENIYAGYANRLKSLANSSRKEMRMIKPYGYSKEAAKKYANERKTLAEKLNKAIKNKPLERAAQIYGNDLWRAIQDSNQSMDSAEKKKEKAKCLEAGRRRYGAGKALIEISDREWEAIQAHAISSNQLKKIIDNSDKDRLKELALPKTSNPISSAKLSVARARLAAGWTRQEIADELGVSVSTLNKELVA